MEEVFALSHLLTPAAPAELLAQPPAAFQVPQHRFG
jgi:hypothetical protein